MDQIRVAIDDNDLNVLEQRYGAALTQKALRVTNTYVMKLQRDAQVLINEAGHVDTGRLANSIKSKVNADSEKVTGEVYAGTKYARFIHEGAQHEGEEIVPHFVPFAVAPSLLIWAKRNKVIYQKQSDGRMRKRHKSGDNWYMMNARGQEYPVDVKKGGLPVKQQPVKYFSVPFARLAPEYLARMAAAITEG